MQGIKESFMRQRKNWIYSNQIKTYEFQFSFYFIRKKKLVQKNFSVLFHEVKKVYCLCWVLKVSLPKRCRPQLQVLLEQKDLKLSAEIYLKSGLLLGCCVCLVFKTSLCLHKFPSRYFIDLGVFLLERARLYHVTHLRCLLKARFLSFPTFFHSTFFLFIFQSSFVFSLFPSLSLF